MSNDQNIEQLKALLTPNQVKTAVDDLEAYGKDWTKVHDPKPLAIVLPKSVEQVQAVVKFANEQNLAVVPSGGRTGLSGGAVAAYGEIVVAMDLMNQVLDFNELDRSVHVQAGVITEQLQQFAEEKSLFYPVDFASAGSSQIGGNVGTNAGGIKVIRYGMTRNWVTGLKVVTGKGDILDLNHGLIKNATGYDFRHLFIGSEGTLGIVVEANIQLTRQPKDLSVLVLGVPDFAAVMKVLHAFQKDIDLTAFEFFSDIALGHVLAHGVAKPFDTEAPFYTLIEFEGVSDRTQDDVMKLFEYCMEQGWVLDGVISQSSAQLENLWQLRERISESIAPYMPYKNDISVTISKVPEFVQKVDDIVQKNYPDFEIVWFGHIGDGNMHLNILKPNEISKEEFLDKCKNVSQWVYEAVKEYGGSISAEHGVGMIKKPFLNYTRTEVELDYMRAMKKVFDPKGVMNPGKLI